MSRRRFYQVSFIIVAVVSSLLIGFLVWRQSTSLIRREQAIQNAIQACNPGYGLQPMEQPTAFEAELTTWGRADNYKQNPDPERPVWVVRMEGRWLLVGGPVPVDQSNAEPSYWNECTIIIDARTGESLSTPIE